MKEGRISLKPTLTEFSKVGFPIEPTPANLHNRYEKHPEKMKIDLYTLLVPAIKEIVETMTEEQPNPSPYTKEFTRLEDEAKGNLSRAITTYIRNHPITPSNPLHAIAGMREVTGGLPSLLTRGTNTATRFMNGMLEALPRAYREKYQQVDHEALLPIAEKNYPLVVMNASLHIRDLVQIQGYGTRNAKSFSTAFSYLQLDDQDRLRFSDSFLETHPASKNPTPGAIGCPALYSDAIYSLWKWHLKGAEQIYHHKYGETKNGVLFLDQRFVAD